MALARLPERHFDTYFHHGIRHAQGLQHLQRGRMKGTGPQVKRGAGLGFDDQHWNTLTSQFKRAQ